MNIMQKLILIAGFVGAIVVIGCPRWVYSSDPLMPGTRDVGYRFLTSPPKPVPVTNEENGLKQVYTDRWLVPHIYYPDLAKRLGLVVILVTIGLWFLGRRKKYESALRTPECPIGTRDRTSNEKDSVLCEALGSPS